MKRLSRREAIVSAGVSLGALLAAPRASASIRWCRRDPVIQIGRTVVDVYVLAEREILETVDGPTVVQVWVPAEVELRHVANRDNGFGQGYDVRLFRGHPDLKVTEDGWIWFKVRVLVPSTASHRVKVRLKDGDDDLDRDGGLTNEWIEVVSTVEL